jgi:mannose-6-phosphate isomerase-like protein (cupin superfamily)
VKPRIAGTPFTATPEAESADRSLLGSGIRRERARRSLRLAERAECAGPSAAYRLLTPNLRAPFEVLWLEPEPGGATNESASSHDSDECLLPLRGTVDVELAGCRYHLEHADAISIQRNVPHRTCNNSVAATELLSIISPPDTV